jgi:hypothetical protein
MKREFRPLAALLAIAGVLDLVMIPFMIHANQHNAGSPPGPAIVLSGVLGVVTLASIAGLAQGRSWAFWAAIVSRIVDVLNSLMGVLFGPGAQFVATGVIAVVISVPAIVLLVRLRSRRTVRAASEA